MRIVSVTSLLALAVLGCGGSAMRRTLSSPKSAVALNPIEASSAVDPAASPSPPAESAWRDVLGVDLQRDHCTDLAMQALHLRAYGDTLVFSGHLDLGQCLENELASGTHAEVLAASEELRVYVKMSCEGVDLAALDGLNYGALVGAGAHPCQHASSIKIVSETDDVQTATLSREGTDEHATIAEEAHRSQHGVIGVDGGPCVYRVVGGKLLRGDCVEINRDIITRSRTTKDGVVTIAPDEGKESYRRAEPTSTRLR